MTAAPENAMAFARCRSSSLNGSTRWRSRQTRPISSPSTKRGIPAQERAAALALTLDGGRRVEPAPLAGDLLAQRVQDLRAVCVAHATQALLHLADEALGVHGGRDCTAKRLGTRGLQSPRDVAREHILFLC